MLATLIFRTPVFSAALEVLSTLTGYPKRRAFPRVPGPEGLRGMNGLETHMKFSHDTDVPALSGGPASRGGGSKFAIAFRERLRAGVAGWASLPEKGTRMGGRARTQQLNQLGEHPSAQQLLYSQPTAGKRKSEPERDLYTGSL